MIAARGAMAAREASLGARVVLVLHNRYRVTGGEERVVGDLAWLAREHLGEEVELLERDSAHHGRAGAAAGLLRGGRHPEEVAAAVRRTGARVVHAHNLLPALRLARAGGGPRRGRARRAAPAQLPARLRGRDLLQQPRRGLHALPRPRHAAGRAPRTAAATARRAPSTPPSLALWQRRMVEAADAVVVPSAAALTRLQVAARARRGPRASASSATSCASSPRARRPRPASTRSSSPGWRRRRASTSRSTPARGRGCRSSSPATGRCAPSSRRGPRARARTCASPAASTTRRSPRCARGPRSRSCPRAARRPSGWPPPRRWPPACPSWRARSARCRSSCGLKAVVAPGDAAALAAAARRRWRDAAAGEDGLRRVRAACGPAEVAARLRAVYDGA